MAEYGVTAVPWLVQQGEPVAAAFPGCHPVHVSTRWACRLRGPHGGTSSGATKTAMFCASVSIYHEHPPQRLARLTDRIVLVRALATSRPSSAADARGALTALGALLRIELADQTVYAAQAR